MSKLAPTTAQSSTVACDGEKETGGHPRVFIKIDHDSGKAVCPYCSKVFVLDPNAKADAH